MMRVCGRWENSLGAHAVFTRNELMQLCAATFGESKDITGDYYQVQYGGFQGILEMLIRFQLSDFAFPAVYVIGQRRAIAQSRVDRPLPI
jgi:hypothetical protein